MGNDSNIELRALIVDDHANARKIIAKFLDDCEWIEVVGEAASGVEAVEKFIDTHPDVLFLDVQMPALNGFEALEQLHSRGYFPHIVFVTAYDEFAVQAFDVHAVDYLSKPVLRSRFDVALQKLRSNHDPTPTALLDYYRKHTQTKQKLLVKSGTQFELLAWSDVILITADGEYSEIWTSRSSFLTEQSMDNLMDLLPDNEFYRIHRATICRLSLINSLVTNGKGGYHIDYDFSSHPELIVSRRRYGDLKKLLKKLL